MDNTSSLNTAVVIGAFISALIVGALIGYMIFLSNPVGTDTGPRLEMGWEYKDSGDYLVVRKGCGDTLGGKHSFIGEVAISVERDGERVQHLVWANNSGGGISTFPIEPGEGILVPNVEPSDTVSVSWEAGIGGKSQTFMRVTPNRTGDNPIKAC